MDSKLYGAASTERQGETAVVTLISTEIRALKPELAGSNPAEFKAAITAARFTFVVRWYRDSRPQRPSRQQVQFLQSYTLAKVMRELFSED